MSLGALGVQFVAASPGLLMNAPYLRVTRHVIQYFSVKRPASDDRYLGAEPPTKPSATTSDAAWLTIGVGLAALFALTLLTERYHRHRYSAADPIRRLSDRERYYLYSNGHR